MSTAVNASGIFIALRLQKKTYEPDRNELLKFFPSLPTFGLHVFSTEKIPDVGRALERNCKDDSVSCAVFTEQCSSVLQMTAA